MLSMQSIIDKTKVLLFGREHSIAGIIPDVTLSEEHTDVLEVTSHPLGKGAPISDHDQGCGCCTSGNLYAECGCNGSGYWSRCLCTVGGYR